MNKQAFVESIVDTLAKEIVNTSKIPHEKYALYISAKPSGGYHLLLVLEHGGEIPDGMVKISVGSEFVADNARSCEVYVKDLLFHERGAFIDPIRQLAHSLCCTEYIRGVVSINVVKIEPSSFEPAADLKSLTNIRAMRAHRFFADWVAEYEADLVEAYIQDWGADDPDLVHLNDWVLNDTEDDQIRMAFSDYVEYCCHCIQFAKV